MFRKTNPKCNTVHDLDDSESAGVGIFFQTFYDVQGLATPGRLFSDGMRAAFRKVRELTQDFKCYFAARQYYQECRQDMGTSEICKQVY